MFEASLVSLLKGNAALSAIVFGRIYPVQGPPDSPVVPYITYQGIPSAPSEYGLDGSELCTKRIQFDLWGQYGDGKTIAIALRNILSGYSGTLSDGTRVLFAKRYPGLDNFDVDSRSYRSIAEYEFLIAEAKE